MGFCAVEPVDENEPESTETTDGATIPFFHVIGRALWRDGGRAMWNGEVTPLLVIVTRRIELDKCIEKPCAEQLVCA